MSAGSAIAPALVRDAAPLFAALGDETRIRLLVRLSSHGPESIARLTARSSVSRQAITKHLGVLSKAGLVQGRRQGRERIWAMAPKRLVEAREHLERISRLWDDALGRLQDLVEAR